MISAFPRHLRGATAKHYVCDPEPQLSGQGGKVPHPASLVVNETAESNLASRKHPHETIKIRQCHKNQAKTENGTNPLQISLKSC